MKFKQHKDNPTQVPLNSSADDTSNTNGSRRQKSPKFISNIRDYKDFRRQLDVVISTAVSFMGKITVANCATRSVYNETHTYIQARNGAMKKRERCPYLKWVNLI